MAWAFRLEYLKMNRLDYLFNKQKTGTITPAEYNELEDILREGY